MGGSDFEPRGRSDNEVRFSPTYAFGFLDTHATWIDYPFLIMNVLLIGVLVLFATSVRSCGFAKVSWKSYTVTSDPIR
jgi:hypothetical protein